MLWLLKHIVKKQQKKLATVSFVSEVIRYTIEGAKQRQNDICPADSTYLLLKYKVAAIQISI